MNKLFYLTIFFVIIGCSSNKIIYWCGDHPCINKTEKEAYFEKTMIDVYSTSVSKKTIDESPMCYKDTQLIMDLVSESVDIIAHLKPSQTV